MYLRDACTSTFFCERRHSIPSALMSYLNKGTFCQSLGVTRSMGHLALQRLLLGLMAMAVLAQVIIDARSAELDSALQLWRSKAYFCLRSTPPFPSKEVVSDPSDCDDGDMTLFNGLLCVAGEQIGCEATGNSQGKDGRWWRSPRRIGWQAPVHDVSFSPDQALGVLLYALATTDKRAFEAWLEWLEANRPCVASINNRCIKKGWVRFCTDDADKRCTLRPADCVRLEMVAAKLALDGSVCRRAARELGIPEDMFLPLDEFTLEAARINDPGYPRHLAAVGVLLARQLGVGGNKIDEASLILATRDPENPFFLYLKDGSTTAVSDLLLRVCPAVDRLSQDRFQWTWERVYNPEAWKVSMYWECIFLASLLS